jgi:hypothetical protein
MASARVYATSRKTAGRGAGHRAPNLRRRGARAAVASAAFAAIALVATGAAASADVRGDAVTYRSPGGVEERCVMLARLPGGIYRDEDTVQERALCAIDVYDRAHAICPKTFSTSPGASIYLLAGARYDGNPAGFEREMCPRGKGMPHDAYAAWVAVKMSVNTRQSSATFANASWIYYHLSRYLDAAVHEPPAVLRSFDKNAYLNRVALPGQALSANSAPLAMNHAGWVALAGAVRDPASYAAPDELLTADRAQLYGALLRAHGERYGEELNGSRRSGWGDGQSRDFQQTAPFIALATDRPLPQAVAEGLQRGWHAHAIPTTVAPVQVAWWMRELFDIVLLDHLLSQQDRVGNIDFTRHWVWVEDGRVRSAPATGRQPPPELAAKQPLLLQRTELGDNDAGVRTSYLNFARRTGMLAAIRHAPPQGYKRLIALAADLRAQGPLAERLRTSYGFSAAEFSHFVANAVDAAETLRASCKAGRLRFDLDPEAFLLDGRVDAVKLDCDRP